MDLWVKLLIIYLAAMNIITLVVCVSDKHLAIKKKRRISEKALFILSVLGGSLGMYSGMYLVRHKTKHLRFTVGIPLIILLQIIIAFLLIEKIKL